MRAVATAKSRRTPSKSPQRPPKKQEEFPWVPLVIGAGLVYLGYQWIRGGAVIPSLPGTRLPSIPTPSGGSSPIPISIDPTLALYSRLRNDSNARDIYNFQAILYEFGYTDAAPDGVIGPITQGLINQVNSIAGTSSGWSSSMVQTAYLAMLATYGSNAQPTRVVPTQLPVDVIQALNQNMLAVSGSLPLIQANSCSNC